MTRFSGTRHALFRFCRVPVFFFLFLSIFSFPPARAAEVTVKTTRESFAAGKPVEIELHNGSRQSVYSLARSEAPWLAVRNFEVRNPRGIWDAFFLKSRQAGGDVFEDAGEIRPGESVTFAWKPAVLEKGREVAPGPGLYRLSVIFHTRRKGKLPVFGTARSNEFRVK